MVRYNSKEDEGYRAISSILKGFIHQMLDNIKIPMADASEISGKQDPPSNPAYAEHTLMSILTAATGTGLSKDIETLPRNFCCQGEKIQGLIFYNWCSRGYQINGMETGLWYLITLMMIVFSLLCL